MIIKEFLKNDIIAKRISLRKLTLSDISDMYEYTSNEEICKYLSWGPHNNLSQATQFIQKVLVNYENPNDILLGIDLNEKLIGVVRLYNLKENQSEISCILNPKYQGFGYMQEAYAYLCSEANKKLNILHVVHFHDINNKSSEKLIEKFRVISKSETKTEIIKDKKVTLRKVVIETERIN